MTSKVRSTPGRRPRMDDNDNNKDDDNNNDDDSDNNDDNKNYDDNNNDDDNNNHNQVRRTPGRRPREEDDDDDDDDVVTAGDSDDEEGSEISTDEEEDESAILMQRRTSLKRQSYLEDDNFIDDDGESTFSDDLEPIDFDEEDEIMQVVLDEQGVGNVIDHYNQSLINSENDFVDETFDDDNDVVAHLENQSMKTDAGLDSEIFEGTPSREREEEVFEDDDEVPDIASSLRFLTDQLLTVRSYFRK